MFVTCIICTESIDKDQEVVVTYCGHCFHNKCIQNWLKNSRTCATCRQATSANSLIKVYFESSDDSKVHDLHNDLLTVNTKLSKELDDIKEVSRLQGEELREANSKLKVLSEEKKMLERTKQCDDMALAGYRSIKESSEEEIVRLKEQINTLSLDLLAEKQLRRIHQTTLNKLDPENPDFKISEILNDESLKQRMDVNGTDKSYSITPFWRLNCEASSSFPSQKDTDKEKKPYVIPSKIQRADPPLQHSKITLNNKFRDHQYKKLVFQQDQPKRPHSSPSTAYFFTAPSQFQKPSLDSASRAPFKFTGQPLTSLASSSTFSRENQNPQNGFQMLSSGQAASSSTGSLFNFSSNNNDRYRERLSTDTPSSSSSKITFPQKISDR